jgi:hypothetical protein
VPTRRQSKDEIKQSITEVVKSVDEASHFLRNIGTIYASRQAARLEIASARLHDIHAALGVKDDIDG